VDVKWLTVILSQAVLRLPGQNEGTEGPPGREGAGDPITSPGGQFLLRAESVEFQRGDLLAGRYQIEKVIGRGATGCVLQAFDRVIRGVVAVKILRPDLASDQRWVERLGGELRYARKLQHPNVCRVFDVSEADGHHFLTMEFAPRGSLRQRLAEKGAKERSWDDRIADAQAVIDGLCAIHAENIVHRDVKPENVLVMEDGRLVVTDFGVAVALGTTTYFSSQVAGTPSYMAPEVIMGEKSTPASDVFSLGITLHEIFFGRRPEWQITATGKVIRPAVTSRSSKRERAFATLCMECLTEFAPRRLQDAATVKRRFELAVGGRLQPLKGQLRARWPLLVGGLAVAAAGGTALTGRFYRRLEPVPAALARPARLLGTADDLGQASRSILTSTKKVLCFDALPGDTSVRVVWTAPPAAEDVDLTTGRTSPAPLLAKTFQTGCPSLSPDGHSLLFTEMTSSGPRILLSPHPDGSEAQTLTEGQMPTWLPSGKEFVYTLDSRLPAVFSFPGTRRVLPASPPLEKQVLDIAVSSGGDRIAFLFFDTRHEYTIEIYGYPSLSLLSTARLQTLVVSIGFDPRRTALQASIADSRRFIRAELTEQGDLRRLGEMYGSNIVEATHTRFGLAFLGATVSRSLEIRSPDGSEKTLPYAGAYSPPALSGSGDALMETRLEDGRLVISLQRWSAARADAVTSGPDDAYPAFAGTGKFSYVRISSNTLMGCSLDASSNAECRPITTDPLGPRSPLPSPDGSIVAYHTAYGAGNRLRVVAFSGGEPRDLGLFTSECPVVWSSLEGLSMYDKERREWRELSARTGRPTGRTQPIAATVKTPCDEPRRYSPLAGGFKTRQIEHQSVDLRLAQDR
jgi:serine/threonine protein kinase